MVDKTFILKMPANYICLINTFRGNTHVCSHEDAMDPKTYQDDCKGKLNDRPAWCPLTEVKVAMQHDVDNKTCWVEK